MELGLAGKKVLIIGGSGDLGKSIAASFVSEGCHVHIVGRDVDKLNQVTSWLAEINDSVAILASQLDVTLEENRLDFVQKIDACDGIPDILINAVSGIQHQDSTKKISNEKKWLSALEGKLVSYMRFCELLIPYMQSKGFGRIINIAGISGSEPSESLFVPGVINAAIDNFTKSLANICGSHGVTVNCINPGFIRSSRFDDYMSHVYSERQLRATEELIELIPLKRLGTPNDVASIACFIASTRASYVNGASIPVDGGFRRGI